MISESTQVETERPVTCERQNTITAFDGYGHRFLEVDRSTGLENGEGVLLMQVVRSRDEDGIEILRQQFLVVFRYENTGSVAFAPSLKGVLDDIATRYDSRAFPGAVGVPRDTSASARADDADSQVFHVCSTSGIWL